MQDMNYLKKIVEEFHSAVVATIDHKGLPQTRAIDMMLYDEKGIYFLFTRTHFYNLEPVFGWTF